MGASLLLPLFPTTPTGAPPPEETAVPTPTQPAPIPTTDIDFNTGYIHPSGLFTATIPDGWDAQNQFSTTGEAQVTFNNPDALSVIEMRVIRPVAGVTLDPEGLSNFFGDAWLRSSWNQYSSWREATRDVQEDRVVIDFNLQRAQQSYIARQIAFSDETWIYVVRVVTPSNASEMLRYVLSNQVENFSPIERYIGAPLEWNGYFDEQTNYLIRFPNGWQVTDSGVGVPTSISGENARLRVETQEGTVDSLDDAEALVADLRSTIAVQTSEDVTQYGLSGYRVAYTIETIDGSAQSGIVQILNDDGTAYIANLLLEDSGATNLLELGEDADPRLTNAVAALDSFSRLPELEIASTDE